MFSVIVPMGPMDENSPTFSVSKNEIPNPSHPEKVLPAIPQVFQCVSWLNPNCMYMYIYIYAWMYAWMYVWMYVCIYFLYGGFHKWEYPKMDGI
jgi:hypothetical protein